MSKFLAHIRIELEINTGAVETAQEVSNAIHATAGCMLLAADTKQIEYSVNVQRIPEKINGV